MILTTHTGSLARPPRLRELLLAIERKQLVDPATFEATCTQAVADVVRKQCEIGLDVINDGEQSKVGFVQYIRQRLHGYDGEMIPRVVSLEGREFPEAAGAPQLTQPCTGPISWKDFAATQRDIARLEAAVAGLADKRVFMNAPSPGTLSNNNPNHYYPSRSAYLAAIVDTMRCEYEAIAAAGFVLQLDCPDLAQRSYNFPDLSLHEWRSIVAENIEAMTDATRNIPREQLRVHVCWGTNEGPHNHDTELSQIVDLVMRVHASAISIVCANGRHEHEWRIWRKVKRPEGLKIIAGVIDSTTNIIEHPQAVAERLIRFAKVLGPDQLMGGVDCGFGTSGTSLPKVDAQVAWAKLRSLVEGARIASERLRRRALHARTAR